MSMLDATIIGRRKSKPPPEVLFAIRRTAHVDKSGLFHSPLFTCTHPVIRGAPKCANPVPSPSAFALKPKTCSPNSPSRTRRTSSFLAAEAIAAYVGHELAAIEGIERGLTAVREGRVIPHDEVMRQAPDIIRAARTKA
jgi:predicted transcriptional regulator